MLDQLGRVEPPISFRLAAQPVAHGAPRFHLVAPDIAIVGFRKLGDLSVPIRFEPLRFHSDEVHIRFHRCVEPRVTPATPWEAHLALHIDARRGPVEVGQGRERWQGLQTIDKPSETVHR